MLMSVRARARGAIAVAGMLTMLAACDGDKATAPSPAAVSAAAKVKHVFVIMLENKNYDDTFGTSTQDPYLQTTLVPQGTLLTQYYGTGHVSLDNYISFISGQSPTPDTENDCVPGLTGLTGNFNDVQQTGTTPDGQVIASGGCVYPASVKTLVDQIAAAGLTWKGYMGDMGNDPARESGTCGHPPLAGTDNTNSAEAPSAAVPQGDAYATRHDPFMYFHSIIDSPSCQTNVVNLDRLATDLTSASTTPNLVFVTPNLCDDGHDGDGTGAAGKGCANGQPGGLTSVDAFLASWVPKIMASPAYQQDGLLLITFDESGYTTTQTTDSVSKHTTVNIVFAGSTCCNEQPGPNIASARPGSFAIQASSSLTENIVINGFGGDRVGALLISQFVNAGGTSATPYNHYGLLKSLEQIFGITTYLGYAAQTGLASMAGDSQIFKAP
ncbi:MAG TPA: alkaline phosphatase family protein [Gemmatimonadaceae bacterium]|nr:alkaline phosphatase family protein [Gemmatimonadaceae bacterium]